MALCLLDDVVVSDFQVSRMFTNYINDDSGEFLQMQNIWACDSKRPWVRTRPRNVEEKFTLPGMRMAVFSAELNVPIPLVMLLHLEPYAPMEMPPEFSKPSPFFRHQILYV